MAKAKKGRPTNPKSKLSRARAMFNRKAPRQDMLKLFTSKLNLTKAGAATYYQICRSE